jgi:hypothetical protein
VHGANPDELILQKNVEPDSLLANAKIAWALLFEAGGADVIVVSGGIVSIRHVYSVGVPGVPPSDTARTAKMCCPSLNPE